MSELKDEVEKLKKELQEMKAGSKSEHGPSVVYMKSDRKFPKFGGRPVKDTDPDVDEWITDMREHIRSSKSKDNHTDFVMDHLIGSAKSEVRLRSIKERETGEQILDILEKVFVTKDTVTQLQQKFYQRDQRENETLEGYSLALMQLSERVNRKAGKEMPVKDHTLIERFIDGLRDQHLRQELRMSALDKAKIPFLEFRFQMLRWIEDNPTVQKSVHKTSASSENSELLALIKTQQEMLLKQQEQIDSLTSMASGRGQGSYQYNFRSRPTSRFPRNRGRGRGRSSSVRDVECYNCGGKGHISRDCPSEKRSDRLQHGQRKSAPEKSEQDPKVSPPH